MGNTDVWLSYVWYASLDGSLATTIYLRFCIGYYEIRVVGCLTHETIEKNFLEKESKSTVCDIFLVLRVSIVFSSVRWVLCIDRNVSVIKIKINEWAI